MANAVEAVKRAAVEAVEAGKPVNIVFGTVIAISPLKIQADQKSIYTSKMLVLSRSVTDYDTDITINGIKQQCRVHNALEIGDKVILLRMQGGKRYIVLDRLRN